MKSPTFPQCEHGNGNVVLKVERVSDEITNLVCIKCGETIAVWETSKQENETQRRLRHQISEENKKKWA